MDKISVIIPTYNRFTYLFNTIKSIQEQTHKNIEIIIVNDCSTQKEYYEYNWNELKNTKIIHLEKNSKLVLGFVSCGYVRNQGIKIATGNYIAFCDDDDIWFSNKLELQIKAMKETGCKMSSTDGLIGSGVYNKNNSYQIYNQEYYFDTLKYIYKNNNSNLLENGFPNIWNLELLKIHNIIICSSVIIEKDLLNKINNFNNLPSSQEDYDCWKRALEYTDSVYIKDICFYYDNGHGSGRDY